MSPPVYAITTQFYTYIVESVNQIQITRLRAKVLLEGLEDEGLEQERIVDGNHLHIGLAIPARLSATRNGLVHDIVGHQEKRLELTSQIHPVISLVTVRNSDTLT